MAGRLVGMRMGVRSRCVGHSWEVGDDECREKVD